MTQIKKPAWLDMAIEPEVDSGDPAAIAQAIVNAVSRLIAGWGFDPAALDRAAGWLPAG